MAAATCDDDIISDLKSRLGSVGITPGEISLSISDDGSGKATITVTIPLSERPEHGGGRPRKPLRHYGFLYVEYFDAVASSRKGIQEIADYEGVSTRTVYRWRDAARRAIDDGRTDAKMRDII